MAVSEGNKFRVDQLRKDKIIYSIEMVAAIAYIAVIPQFLDNFLGTFLGDSYFNGGTRVMVFKIAAGLGILFFLYLIAMSVKVHKLIRSLESASGKE